MDTAQLDAYLAECRALALAEIREIMPSEPRYREVLYDLALDYPLRQAKALRPALCIATCRALGGSLESVLRSAAVLELYHNAFLIHDDVEDGSELRRDRPTLHRTHGAPIAVNVGDAMLALALQPLLDNMAVVGMGKALRVLQVVARMARESAEGQALELHWIRSGDWHRTDADYFRMVCKKTSWYSFITPLMVGGIVAGADAPKLARLRRFAALLGIAFQIQDDVLNLRSEGGAYGKEAGGDLWEGKHTLILLHALRNAPERERERAGEILRKPRPTIGRTPRTLELLKSLAASGALDEDVARQIEAATRADLGFDGLEVKSQSDVEFLQHLIERNGSIGYASQIASQYARRSRAMLEGAHWMHESVHLDFLHGIVDFVVARER